MRVSYPLSLKVSLWLILNLVLLAAIGIGFFVYQGGLRWDALVIGPNGDRLSTLVSAVSTEAGAASGDARNAVLSRFGAANGADFYLFGADDAQIAGAPVELPEDVRRRMEARPLRPNPPFGERKGPPGGRGEGFRGPASELDLSGGLEGPDKSGRDAAERPPRKKSEVGEKGRPPPGFGGSVGPGGAPDPASPRYLIEQRIGRFVVRSGTPAAYWVGVRTSFAPLERSRPIPARMIVRVGTLWGLFHLLNLQPWLIAGAGVLTFSVLFWWPLVHGITRSLGQLTRATEQIAEGRFDTRVQTSRRDELGKLGDSVNRMANRLDAHMNGQKRFLGDVAHELCSPLARLQMATGILSDQAPKELKETVADVREEVQQMSTLVNELLAFTKAGLQAREVILQPIDLESLVRETLDRENAAARVSLQVPTGLRALGERELLSRAVGNLVRNAVRYAGEAGPITITAGREKGAVSLVVEDCGTGVPPADIDRLGEPFFRPELARTRESGGVGLGLAIVRNSVAACKGEVRFANRSPRGFRAELRLNEA